MTFFESVLSVDGIKSSQIKCIFFLTQVECTIGGDKSKSFTFWSQDGDLEEIFNKFMSLKIPFTVDFKIDKIYLADTRQHKEIIVMYDTNDQPYHKLGEYDDIQEYDDYNINLLKLYELMEIV